MVVYLHCKTITNNTNLKNTIMEVLISLSVVVVVTILVVKKGKTKGASNAINR